MARSNDKTKGNEIRTPFKMDENFLGILKNGSESPASLFNITLVRIARSLWFQYDVRSEIVNSCTFFNNKKIKYDKEKCWDKLSNITRKVLMCINYLKIPKNWEEKIEKEVTKVGDEIIYFLFYRLCSDAKKVNIYLDNLRWTSQGRIDKMKTTVFLLEHEGLSTLAKYELACSMCSEEKINYYLEKLSENFINKFIKGQRFKLMVYWTFYVRGKLQRVNKICRGKFKCKLSTVDMFRWSCDTKNEFAAYHFLNKDLNNSMQGKLKAAIYNGISDDPLLPHLMAHLEPDNLREFCIEHGYELLKRLANDWRLKSYFAPAAKYVLQFIRKIYVGEAFEIIVLCWNENVLRIKECKNFIDDYVNYIKKKDGHILMSYTCQKLLSSFFALGAADAMKFLLRKWNTYNTDGIKFCSDLILKGEFDYCEIFIENLEFKSLFFKRYYFIISESLITLGKYQILDKFFKFFSYDNEEVMHLKLELPYKNSASIIRNILKNSSYIYSYQLKAIDEFLHWCFEGDVSKMSNCKVEIFEIDSQYKELQEQYSQQIFEMSMKGELELVDTYINWAFCTCDIISKFKTQFFEKRGFDICRYMITDKIC